MVFKETISSKELIERHSKEIYEYFFRPDFVIGEYYTSPLRPDSNPSFNLFEARVDRNIILFKDWAGWVGNAIDFVMIKHGLVFEDAIATIVESLNLPYITREGKSAKIERAIGTVKTHSTDKNELKIKVDVFGGAMNPEFTDTDKWYWTGRLGIPLEYILKEHSIYSCRDVYINGVHFATYQKFKPVYLYLERYEDKKYCTIYQPFAKPENKWRKNMNGMAHLLIHNYKKLPSKGDELIITKSTKDNVILSYLGFNCCSVQGEDLWMDNSILSDLKERFKDIYLFFDNDFNKSTNYGYELSDKYAAIHKLKQIKIPREVRATDTEELLLLNNKSHIVTRELINHYKCKN